MKRLTFVLFLLAALLLAGCVTTLPVGTSTPQPLPPTAEPDATSAPAPTPTPATVIPQPEEEPIAVPEEEEAIEEEAPADEPGAEQPETEPAPPRVVTPQPPSAEQARDLALNFLREGYRLRLPDNESFLPAELTLASVDMLIQAGFASGNIQVIVGEPFLMEGRALTPVIVAVPRENARWWGEVDHTGLVVTTVAAGLPRPASQRVRDWVGRVVKLPPGSPYDDYFEGELGNRHGIDSNIDSISAVLESLTDYPGRVRITGELRYGVQDYNGRRLLVSRIELLDGPLPAAEAESAEELATEESPPDETTAEIVPFFGPTGAIIDPLPGARLRGSVLVTGEAEGVFENNVIIRFETADGALLGEGFATTDAPDLGQRGGFAVELPFEDPPGPTNGRVVLYSEDAQDGSLLVLAWVNVRFAGAGAD